MLVIIILPLEALLFVQEKISYHNKNNHNIMVLLAWYCFKYISVCM